MDGLTLLVGALSKKVENFEGVIEEISDKLNYVVEKVDNFDAEISNNKLSTNKSFQKAQENFKLLEANINSNFNHYQKFSAYVNDELKEIKGAIFLPEEDSDIDSEYKE